MKHLEEVKREIFHRTDGPVTEFVAISRAIDLVKMNEDWDNETIANALSEGLDELRAAGGRYDSNEFPGSSAL